MPPVWVREYTQNGFRVIAVVKYFGAKIRSGSVVNRLGNCEQFSLSARLPDHL
jgi:hypothetical protein